MKSMHEQYALEGKNKDGTPSGVFWMNKATASAAATEVLTNNLKWDAAKVNEQLNTYFEKAWAHFDVNQIGRIKAVEMGRFITFLSGTPFIDGLHAQKQN